MSEGTSGCGGEEPPEPQGWAWGSLEVRGGFGMGEDWSQLGLGREGGCGVQDDIYNQSWKKLSYEIRSELVARSV